MFLKENVALKVDAPKDFTTFLRHGALDYDCT